MNESPELEYVGFWARVWASIIDTVLMMLVIFPVMFDIYGREQMASGLTITGLANILISYLLPAVVVIAFWTAKHATPGKMVVGATIVDEKTGGPPSLGQHVIRYLGYFVSTIPFGIGLIWVAFDKRKQGWHDKLAGTVVVRAKNSGTEPAVRFGVYRTMHNGFWSRSVSICTKSTITPIIEAVGEPHITADHVGRFQHDARDRSVDFSYSGGRRSVQCPNSRAEFSLTGRQWLSHPVNPA